MKFFVTGINLCAIIIIIFELVPHKRIKNLPK